ncbi:PhnD/SsuA/transferrin family substrate-binding protein [bacterium]|nr:PhnD/SsuA/transferrin family substrate-binding protein [bacterium]
MMRVAVLFACVLGVLSTGSLSSASAQSSSSEAATETARVATPAPFRVAVEGAEGACTASAGEPGAEALRSHLEHRLKRTVLACGFATKSAAGAALAAGDVDLAMLDGPAFVDAGAGAASGIRALVAPRAAAGVGRILTVGVVRGEGKPASLKEAGTARIVYAGTAPPFYAGPRAAALDHGLAPPTADREVTAAGPEAALSALRAGEADLMLLHASAWQRVCRGERTGDMTCGDLKEIWRGRSSASVAWSVRLDMDRETMLRLVGVLVALHLENRPAFEWMAPGAGELTPTEAGALAVGG